MRDNLKFKGHVTSSWITIAKHVQ